MYPRFVLPRAPGSGRKYTKTEESLLRHIKETHPEYGWTTLTERYNDNVGSPKRFRSPSALMGHWRDMKRDHERLRRVQRARDPPQLASQSHSSDPSLMNGHHASRPLDKFTPSFPPHEASAALISNPQYPQSGVPRSEEPIHSTDDPVSLSSQLVGSSGDEAIASSNGVFEDLTFQPDVSVYVPVYLPP
jgi:hypothetical protein